MRLQLFGEIRLFQGETEVQFPFRNCGRLLARLACEPQHRLSRAELARDLWPESQPAIGLANLRKTLQVMSAHPAGKALGRDREEVWLVPEVLTCDLWDTGDSAKPRSNLLEGIREPWVEEARRRLGGSESAPTGAPWNAFEQIVQWQLDSGEDSLYDFLRSSHNLIVSAPPEISCRIMRRVASDRTSSPETSGLAHIYLGQALMCTPESARSKIHLLTGLEMLHSRPDPQLTAFAHEALAITCIHRQEFEASSGFIRRIPNPVSRLNLRSLLHWNQGDYARAVQIVDARHRELGEIAPESELAFVLNRMIQAGELSDRPMLERLAPQAEDLRRRVRHARLGMVYDMATIAYQWRIADIATAAKTARASFDRMNRAGFSSGTMLDLVSVVCAEAGEHDFALDLYLQSGRQRRQGAIIPAPSAVALRARSKELLVKGLGAETCRARSKAR